MKSTATIDANQRLAILQERILSDTRLGQVADELGLYRNMKATKTQDQIMTMMRSKITIDSTTTAPPARALKSFNVSFTSPNAAVAAKVSNRLASLFIEENLKVREQQVMGTADFFDGQLQKAKEEVDEKAQKLAELKAHYAAELPEAQNLHLQALTSAQTGLARGSRCYQPCRTAKDLSGIAAGHEPERRGSRQQWKYGQYRTGRTAGKSARRDGPAPFTLWAQLSRRIEQGG